MDTITLDGSAAAIMVALERKKAEQRKLIAERRNDESFRDGLQAGVKHYSSIAALHDMHLAQLKREYTRGVREHIRKVHRFLSSDASGDPHEMRDMLNFVVGLLRCCVSLVEQQVDAAAASALASLDPHDLACV